MGCTFGYASSHHPCLNVYWGWGGRRKAQTNVWGGDEHDLSHVSRQSAGVTVNPNKFKGDASKSLDLAWGATLQKKSVSRLETRLRACIDHTDDSKGKTEIRCPPKTNKKKELMAPELIWQHKVKSAGNRCLAHLLLPNCVHTQPDGTEMLLTWTVSY